MLLFKSTDVCAPLSHDYEHLSEEETSENCFLVRTQAPEAYPPQEATCVTCLVSRTPSWSYGFDLALVTGARLH